MDTLETSRAERTRTLPSAREWTAIGLASGLMAVNVAVMYALAFTPLVAVNRYLFSVPLVGVIVYGAALVGGEMIAERGVERGQPALAFAGAAILQLAFGVFGAGLLAFAPPDARLVALGITAVVTAGLTFLLATYVYVRSKDFDDWGTYANGAFLLGIVAVAIGSVYAPVLPAGFVLIFAGFLLRLGWEIWRVRERDRSVALSAIGIYVAAMGVFVHVLQLVLRAMARRG